MRSTRRVIRHIGPLCANLDDRHIDDRLVQLMPSGFNRSKVDSAVALIGVQLFFYMVDVHTAKK